MTRIQPALPLASILGERRVLNELFLVFAYQAVVRHDKRAKASRAVLLIPGFLAGDASLYPLAQWLRAEGHKVFLPGIRANVGCCRRTIDRLSKLIVNISDQVGNKVVLVGHSLGGIYSRELARRHPALIERAFLLGAPVRAPLENSHPYIRALFVATRRAHADGGSCMKELASLCGTHWSEPPRDVPVTIIFSKRDGVVNWPACIEWGPNIEAIEVRASHCGIPYNFDTLRVISERLRRPKSVNAAHSDDARPEGSFSSGGPRLPSELAVDLS